MLMYPFKSQSLMNPFEVFIKRVTFKKSIKALLCIFIHYVLIFKNKRYEILFEEEVERRCADKLLQKNIYKW